MEGGGLARAVMMAYGASPAERAVRATAWLPHSGPGWLPCNSATLGDAIPTNNRAMRNERCLTVNALLSEGTLNRVSCGRLYRGSQVFDRSDHLGEDRLRIAVD